MKIKLSILLVALFLMTTNIFASFPVKRAAPTVTTGNTATETNEDVESVFTYAGSKNQYVAAALAFFLGMFGIHNFYLGYNKSGIWQIILTVLFITSPISDLWALIDFVRILIGDLQPKNGSYN